MNRGILTVGELIEKLKEYDSHAFVCVDSLDFSGMEIDKIDFELTNESLDDRARYPGLVRIETK